MCFLFCFSDACGFVGRPVALLPVNATAVTVKQTNEESDMISTPRVSCSASLMHACFVGGPRVFFLVNAIRRLSHEAAYIHSENHVLQGVSRRAYK